MIPLHTLKALPHSIRIFELFHTIVSQKLHLFIAGLLVTIALTGCSRPSARLIDAVKEIPLSGGHDTIYIERSNHWDRGLKRARTDSNRQTIVFKPASGEIAYVTLRNMGGVPLKRDTIQGLRRFPAELFLRTGTLDTNMHLNVEFSDWHKAQTDVVVYIRNRDSVYREFLLFGK